MIDDGYRYMANEDGLGRLHIAKKKELLLDTNSFPSQLVHRYSDASASDKEHNESLILY